MGGRIHGSRKRLNVESADITKLSVTATLRRMSRLLLVALSIVAWFSISNHCVIGALKTSKSMQAACHGDGAAPTKLPAKGEPVSCCKVLRATLAKTNTNVAVDALVFVLQQYFVTSLFFPEGSQHASLLGELDTGPPFALSFTELVLQRSVLVHAPPHSA